MNDVERFMPRTHITHPGACPIPAVLLRSTILLLLLFLSVPVYAQVEVTLRYGGTLRGYVVAKDDSTITLRVAAGDGSSRDAVLRRSDITFEEGTDDILPPPEAREGEAVSESASRASLRYRHDIMATVSTHKEHLEGFRFSYEYFATPLLRDTLHTTDAAARVQPTSSFDTEFTLDRILRARRYSVQVGGSVLLDSALAPGGQVFFGREDHDYGPEYAGDEPYRLGIIGHLGLYVTPVLRLREAVGGGFDRGGQDTSGTFTNGLFLFQHRLDYAIDRPLHFLGSTIWLGYMHTLTLHHLQGSGSVLQFNNGIEASLGSFYSIGAVLQLTAHMPELGETDVSIGAGFRAAWYFRPAWSIILQVTSGRELWWYDDTDLTETSMHVEWRF
jgi:hypothetical protein